MSASRCLRSLGVSCVLAALAWPTAVCAQPLGTDPTTRAAYDAYVRGTGALNARQYEAAVQALEESYRLSRSSATLYPLALAHRELGHTRLAIEQFERYLVEEPTFPPGRESAVRDVVRELRARLATVALRVAPDTYRLSVDDRDTPVVDSVVALDPGDHTLSVSAAGYVTWRERVHVEPGQRIERDVTLTREGTATVTSPDRASPITSRWWFWAGVGVAVVGGVTTGVLVARANAEPEPWTPGTFFNVVTIRVP